jgi:hypothetical protein
MRLESLLAGVLGYGTWLASALIALGLGWALATHADAPTSVGLRIVAAGIVLFIALPILRLVAMLVMFARQRDGRFVAITATVLVIIFLGFMLGMWMSTSAEG